MGNRPLSGITSSKIKDERMLHSQTTGNLAIAAANSEEKRKSLQGLRNTNKDVFKNMKNLMKNKFK